MNFYLASYASASGYSVSLPKKFSSPHKSQRKASSDIQSETFSFTRIKRKEGVLTSPHKLQIAVLDRSHKSSPLPSDSADFKQQYFTKRRRNSENIDSMALKELSNVSNKPLRYGIITFVWLL